MAELVDQPLSEIALALRGGRLAAEAIAEAAIDRHRRVGAALNAYKAFDADKVLAQARAADAAFKSGRTPGALHGVPVSIKDLFGVGGFPTYAGSPRPLPARFETEGSLLRALRAQLAVVAGKSHTVEFAYGALGTNPHWGTPRNPWDAARHRVPGGSSSGAGVSLWEGSALLAIGSDTGGSVRIPASMTGTVGLKTTIGRWATDGIVPLSPSLDSVGALARSVADLCYGFGALDPAWGEPEAFLRALGPPELMGVRLGLSEKFLWDDCTPELARAVKAALDRLTAKGARIVPLDMNEFAEAYELHLQGSLISAELAAFLHDELPEWASSLDPTVRKRIEGGSEIPAREFVQRQRRFAVLAARVGERLGEVDAQHRP